MYDTEEVRQDGNRIGWLRLMDGRGIQQELTVMQHGEEYVVLSDDDTLLDMCRTLEDAFDAVAREISGALLNGAWIEDRLLPEGWILGTRITIRPPRQERADEHETTPMAEWLGRRGWSVYEAAKRTALSESSLRRWTRGYKTAPGGEHRPVPLPRYVERMIELVDALVELGSAPGRWESLRLDAVAFAHWVDQRPRSQRRAAEMLGVSPSQVSAWVHGRAEVPTYITRLIGLIERHDRLSAHSLGRGGGF